MARLILKLNDGTILEDPDVEFDEVDGIFKIVVEDTSYIFSFYVEENLASGGLVNVNACKNV